MSWHHCYTRAARWVRRVAVVAIAATLIKVYALTLAWNEPVAELPADTIAEVWSSPDLINWSLYAEVPANAPVCFLAVPTDKPQMFFKVRNRARINGFLEWSDWST